MRKAFTLIELIITMVILSIVAYIASGLIAKTFMGYNRANNIQRADLRVEIALNSIANRLENAIAGTIVKGKSDTDSSVLPIDNELTGTYSVLEWVGNDIDGFEAVENNASLGNIDKPAWSGFCNINDSNKTYISTPGSNLNFAQKVIDNLSDGNVSFTGGKVAIFFPGNYDYSNIGYNGSSTSGVALVSGVIASSTQQAFIINPPISRVTEHYKLAWSAYAIVPVNCDGNGVCDLELRYNFRPWKGIDYTSSSASKSLLAKNVTVFKTFATQNRVHIKLCIQDRIGLKSTTSVCKEKVVYK